MELTKRCHRNCITSVAHFDSKVATGGKDSTVLVHDLIAPDLPTVSRYNISTPNSSTITCSTTTTTTTNPGSTKGGSPPKGTNVLSVDFYNNLIISGNSLGDLNLIDLKCDGVVLTKRVHNSLVSSIHFIHPNNGTTGSYFVSAGFDRKIKLWDLRNLRAPLHLLIGHTSNINQVDLTTTSFTGGRGASTTGGSTTIWDDTVRAEEGDNLVNFGESFQRVLSCGSDRTLRLWDVNKETHLLFKVPLSMSQNVDTCCLISTRPNYLFAAGLDNHLLLFSSRRKEPILKIRLPHTCHITTIKCYKQVLLVGTNQGHLMLYDISTTTTGSSGPVVSLELLEEYNFDGSINDLQLVPTTRASSSSGTDVQLLLLIAVGSEVRLGRWFTNPRARNQLVAKDISMSFN